MDDLGSVVCICNLAPHVISSWFFPERAYHLDRRRSCNGCKAASAQRTCQGAARADALSESVTPQFPPEESAVIHVSNIGVQDVFYLIEFKVHVLDILQFHLTIATVYIYIIYIYIS